MPKADTQNMKAAAKGDAATSKAEHGVGRSIFDDVPVSLVAELGRGEMNVSELLALGPGSEVLLDAPLDGLVTLKLNGRLVARGELVAVGDQFGVRISEVIAAGV